MKAYLINPDYMIYGDPPLGLAYLASYAKSKIPSLDMRILDQIEYKKIISILEKEKPALVGISSVSENWFRVKYLAAVIKQRLPNIKLIIGGVHITTSQSSFEKSAFDYAVLGEGEIPFAKIIDLIKKGEDSANNLRKIQGLMFRDNRKVVSTGIAEQVQDLDEIPMPDFEMLNMKYYSLPRLSSGLKRSFMILTSRGCPYNCKFCSSSCFWERKIRFFSAKRVVREIEIAYRKYRFDFIHLGDDLFSINEGRLTEIIAGLREKKLLGKIEFICAARSNVFKESTAKLLKELGVKTVSFGFESGSGKVLKWLKGETISIEMHKAALGICEKHGLSPMGFFMIGSPYETLEDMEKTEDFIRNYCKERFILYQTIAYPGTEVWNYALKNKIIQEDMYERKTKEFITKDARYLLTKEVSRENFEKIYKRINSLHTKKAGLDIAESLRNIKLKNMIFMLNLTFIKKAINLRKRFLNRIW